MTEEPELSSVCLDDNGAVKDVVRRRFAHLINVYITRGKPSAEFGDNLYSVDIDDGEEMLSEPEPVTQDNTKDDEVIEITTIDDSDEEENKENDAKNGNTEGKNTDEKNELDALGDDDDNADEEVDDKLLDEAD